jgi:hypothetical protein
LNNIYGPAILTVSVTVLLAVMGLFFRAGGLTSRVEELERWRGNVRTDMHEISNMLQDLGKKITNLDTLIRERTDRRTLPRPDAE